MKAVIMAGGEGRRLRPITEKMPKPLAPVGGIPVIVGIIKALSELGIKEAAVTTGYLAETIENEIGCECCGIKLKYFKECLPLGTAGGVLTAKAFIGNDDFVVMSGDAMIEVDLASAAKKRRELDCDALILLSEQSEVGEYGVVLTDRDGRITGFAEKPSLSGTYSNTVNTGIYFFSSKIFELIPPNRAYDFGKDLFPDMLRGGREIYSVTDSGYWCDIGDPEAYYRANMRCSGGDNSIAEGAKFDGAKINASVIMKNCRIEKDAVIDSAILCEGVTVCEGAKIGHGCVIGADSVIEKDAVILDGVSLPADTLIASGSKIKGHTLFTDINSASALLGGGGILCKREDMTVSLAARLGIAIAAASGGGRIGIMQDRHGFSDTLAATLIRGIRLSDGVVQMLGYGFEAQASYASVSLGLVLTVFIRCHGDTVEISFFDKDGLYPKRDFERKLLSSLVGEAKPFHVSHAASGSCDFSEEVYLPFITEKRLHLSGMKINVLRENPSSVLLSRALLANGGILGIEGLRFSVSDDGFSVTAEQDGFVADDLHIKAILLKYLVKGELALPCTVPTVLSDICGARAKRYSHCPTGDGEDSVRAKAKRHPELIHGCVAALELAGLISASGKSLKELASRITDFSVDSSELIINDKKRLSVLKEIGSPDGDGVKAEYQHGSVRVVASRNGFSLTAEAVSGEYAREILDLSKKEIKKILGAFSSEEKV